jgi:hypothetical protein
MSNRIPIYTPNVKVVPKGLNPNATKFVPKRLNPNATEFVPIKRLRDESRDTAVRPPDAMDLLDSNNVIPDSRTEPSRGDEEEWFATDDARGHGSTGKMDDIQLVSSGVYKDNISIAENQKAKKIRGGEEEVNYPEKNLGINFNDGNAHRLTDPTCFIQFTVSNRILRIQHFICPGGGKELLLDLITVLSDLFDNIELTAADLDPKPFAPKQFDQANFDYSQKTIKDMVAKKYIVKGNKPNRFKFTKKYRDMKKYIFKDETGKYKYTGKYYKDKEQGLFKAYEESGFTRNPGNIFKGTKDHILQTLRNYARPVPGGSRRQTKTKRRQTKKTKKRRQKKTKRKQKGNKRRQTKKRGKR